MSQGTVNMLFSLYPKAPPQTYSPEI